MPIWQPASLKARAGHPVRRNGNDLALACAAGGKGYPVVIDKIVTSRRRITLGTGQAVFAQQLREHGLALRPIASIAVRPNFIWDIGQHKSGTPIRGQQPQGA